MIYKTKYMEDRGRCSYSQRNNSYEGLLGEFETCGPTADMSCLNSVGYKTKLVEGVQEEDIATSFLNNSSNYEAFREIRGNLEPGSIPGNRVPQYYPYMNKVLFKAKSEYFEGNVESRVIGALKNGASALICFHSPGHFVAAVGYNNDLNEVIYNDPLGGFNLRFHVKRFGELYNWGVVIYPKG